MQKKKQKKLKKRKFDVGFRVHFSEVTEKYCVVLTIDTFVVATISPHYKVEDAYYGVSRCRNCLRSMGERVYSQPWRRWFQKFILKLTTEFSYKDDDEALAIVQDGETLDRSKHQQEYAAVNATIQNL